LEIDQLKVMFAAKRKAEHLTFRQLAVITGLSTATLCRFETKDFTIDAKTLLAIQKWVVPEIGQDGEPIDVLASVDSLISKMHRLSREQQEALSTIVRMFYTAAVGE
jgi:transcriptional regulator with XRE-family HTH domain